MFRKEGHKIRKLTGYPQLFWSNSVLKATQHQMTNHARKWKYTWILGFETLYTNSSNLSRLNFKENNT